MGRLGAGGAIMTARVIDPLYKIARELGIADDALWQVIKDYEAGRRYTVDRADDFTFNKEPRSNGARVGGKSIAGAAKPPRHNARRRSELKALDTNCDVTGVFRLHGGCGRRPRL